METTGEGLLRQLRSKVENLTLSLTQVQAQLALTAHLAGLSVADLDAPLMPQASESGDGPEAIAADSHGTQDGKPRRSWWGAAAFAAFGAVIGVFVTEFSLLILFSDHHRPSSDSDRFYNDIAQTVGLLCGGVLFGICGVWLLPCRPSPLMGKKRGVLELMVVAGWVAASYSNVLSCMCPNIVDNQPLDHYSYAQNIVYYSGQLLFMLSSIFFTALAVNNVDWQIANVSAERSS
jgi:hypothetical protein